MRPYLRCFGLCERAEGQWAGHSLQAQIRRLVLPVDSVMHWCTMDSAGIDKPAFMQPRYRPLKGRVTSVSARLPDCCLSQPRPFRGFLFPVFMVRARGLDCAQTLWAGTLLSWGPN